MLGAGDLDHSEGVHEREIFPGPGVAVGAQQWETVIPGVHQRQPEALDQRGVDIGDEVAEVVDADDDAADAARLDRRVLHPRRNQCADRLAQGLWLTAPGGELGGDRSENISAVEGGARTMHSEVRKLCAPEAHDERVAHAVDDGGQQAVVGRQEIVSAGLHGENVPRGADARIDHGDVHGGGREVAEGARQPEARLRRPVHHDLIHEIDDARTREAREHATLHDAHERPLMAEVGRDGDDP